MKLLINIGNTNVWFAYGSDGLYESIKLRTGSLSYDKGIHPKWIKKVSEIAYASVVPNEDDKLLESLEKIPNIQIKKIHSKSSPIVKSKYNLKQLGVDRMLAIHGAILKYNTPFILCDLGTASTFNVVDENGWFLGGMIMPGLGLSVDVLNERTGQLEKVGLSGNVNPIADNTEDAIRSGVILSNVYMLERLHEEYGFPIILTGGNANFIEPFITLENFIIDQNLLMEGMEDLL